MANYTLEVQCAPQRAGAGSSQLAFWDGHGEGSSAPGLGQPGTNILGESEPDVAPARKVDDLKSVELCAGAGGQALGLHSAGFTHVALVEWDKDACATLRHNGRPWGWDGCVHQADVRRWRPEGDLGQIALVSAGVPCPPFSIAGKQLGPNDERDLFPALLDVVDLIRPRAVQAENVRGLLSRRFDEYRSGVESRLGDLGYVVYWRLLNACDFGVAQLRPRTVMVALSPGDAEHFSWPEPPLLIPPTVGEVLIDSMRSRGWEGAEAWAALANQIAPTLVGGSRKHGGPDLGPTRARQAWARG